MNTSYSCPNCRRTLTTEGAGPFVTCACGTGVVTAEEAQDLAIELLQFTGWCPMKTAPRDGTRILAMGIGGHPCLPAWNAQNMPQRAITSTTKV